jgi:predicted nucleic-acid-binding Zn-ribbon protein
MKKNYVKCLNCGSDDLISEALGIAIHCESCGKTFLLDDIVSERGNHTGWEPISCNAGYLEDEWWLK